MVRYLERTGQLPAERLESGQRIFRLADVDRLAREREKLVSTTRPRSGCSRSSSQVVKTSDGLEKEACFP